MAGNAYIMTAYDAESEALGTANIDYVMGATGAWIDVSSDITLVAGAATYLDALFPIQEIRRIQGEFQSKYVDRDVRMERVTVAITYPAV